MEKHYESVSDVTGNSNTHVRELLKGIWNEVLNTQQEYGCVKHNDLLMKTLMEHLFLTRKLLSAKLDSEDKSIMDRKRKKSTDTNNPCIGDNLEGKIVGLRRKVYNGPSRVLASNNC